MPFLRAKRVGIPPIHRVERIVTLRFSTTDRIASGITSTIEKLLADDRYGEVYRSAVAHLHSATRPPLASYLGCSSVCRIDGPLEQALDDHLSGAHLPAGGLIETPGQTIRLSLIEANALQRRIQSAIEREILGWVCEGESGVQCTQQGSQGVTDVTVAPRPPCAVAG
jgi:hypothetical protein